MIKKIESYPELTDPQLRPRYSGIPTFFRTPHTVPLGALDGAGMLILPPGRFAKKENAAERAVRTKLQSSPLCPTV